MLDRGRADVAAPEESRGNWACSVGSRPRSAWGAKALLAATLAFGGCRCGETSAVEELRLSPAALPVGIEGTPYSQSLTASGGSGAGYAWEVTAGSLPPGLALSASGTPSTTLSGTPTQAGTFSFTVGVNDSAGASAAAAFTVAINSALAITTASLPEPIEAAPYNETIAASGGAGGTLTWSVSAGDLPAGLALSGAGPTASISGTPTAAGPYSFTLQVADSASSDRRTYSGTVGPRLDIAAVTPALGVVQSAYAQPVTSTGGTGAGHLWSVTAGVLPPGLTLSSTSTATVSIDGTPTTAGSFDVTLRVEDSSGVSVTAALTLVVNDVLQIEAAPLPDARPNLPYSANVTASGGSQVGYSWSIDSGALPSGLALAPSGTPSATISGTPTSIGAFNFTLRVTDSLGGTAVRAFTLKVEDPLEIVTLTLPDAIESSPYTAAVTAGGGSQTGYTWSIASGVLPGGLTLAASGTPSTTISGAPATAGTYAFTLRVTDDTGNFDDQALTLVVSPGIAISTATLPDAIVDVPYSETINSTGGSGSGQRWFVVAGVLPPGLTIPTLLPSHQLALFTYTGVSGATPVVDADVVDAEVQSPVQISRVNLGASANTGEYGASGWTASTTTFDPTQYYSVRISPKPGGILNLTRFETRARQSSTSAPNMLHIRSSVDGFTTTLLTIPLTTSYVLHGVNLPASFSNLASEVELRIHASGATSTSTSLFTYLDDTRLFGEAGVLSSGPSTTLSGTPTTPGSYTFTLRVTDSSGTIDERTYSIDVGPRLGVATTSLPVAVAQTPYSETVSATGGTAAGHSWSVASGALPSGLTLGDTTSATATITGTPTAAGTSSFTLEVTDSSGVSATRPFTLVVNDALSIVTASLAQGSIGVPYTETFTASGGAGAGYSWRVSSGALPAGLTLSATGTLSATLSGTPSVSGTYNFELEVTDAYANVATRSFSLVLDGALAIFTAPLLAEAIQNVPYSAAITGVGGTETGYAWQEVLPGTLPPGLTLGASGTPSTTLTGTPTTPGSFTFSVRLTDSAATVVEKTFTLDVGPALEIATTALPQAAVTGAYQAALTATGGSQSGFSWQVSSGALPPGLNLAASGTPSTNLSGTPTQAGTFNFTVQVTDSTGQSDAQAYTLSVAPPVDIVTTALAPASLHRGYREAIAATSGSGSGYTWSIVSGALPSGLTLAPTGTPSTALSGVPRAAGSFAFAVRVVDSLGASDTESFTLEVSDLEIRPGLKVDGTINAAFTQTLTGAGGTGTDYTWAVTSGALPPGLTLGATGTPSTTIAGTPTALGSYLFTVTLTDSAGATAFRRFAIDVRRPQRYAVAVGDELVDGQYEPVLYDLAASPPSRHRVLPNGGAWPTSSDAATGLDNFRFSPDGSKLAFVADLAVDGGGELWLVDLTGGPTIGSDFVATRVSTTAQTTASLALVTELVWSPDSRKLAYRGDLDLDGVFELYLTDVTNPGAPGPQQKISPPATTAQHMVPGATFGWDFSPDGMFVALRGDFHLNGRSELFATYVGPGATYVPFLVNAPISGTLTSSNDIDRFWWAPRHPSRLVYFGQPETDSVSELFLADLAPSGVTGRFKLNGPLVASGDVSSAGMSVEPSPDGSMLFYLADQEVDTKDELYVVDLSGPVPGPAVKVSSSGVARVVSARWSPDSTRLAYADYVSYSNALFMVDVRAPGAATQVNPATHTGVTVSTIVIENPFASGSTATDTTGGAGFTFSPDGTQIAFVAGAAGSTSQRVLLVADLSSPGKVVSQLSAAQGQEVSSYLWAPDSSGIAYVGDLDTSSIAELYHVDLTTFPTVAAPIKLSRTPAPSGGDVMSASIAVHFYGPGKIAYLADDRYLNAIEAVFVDFSNPAAIFHSALSAPAATSAFNVNNLRITPGRP